MKRLVLEYELPIKVTPQKEGGYVATSPYWKDCYAQGETVDEAILEITAVAQSLIELYKEENIKVPLRHSTERSVSKGFSIPVIVEA